jgi:hypothetical protein
MKILFTTPTATVSIGPYDSHVWDWAMHRSATERALDAALDRLHAILTAPLTEAELEAQRFADRLAAVGIDTAHELMQR